MEEKDNSNHLENFSADNVLSPKEKKEDIDGVLTENFCKEEFIEHDLPDTSFVKVEEDTQDLKPLAFAENAVDSGKQHLKLQQIHTGEKPFKCDICSKLFSRASNLKIHQRVHTREKPFKCEVCSELFSHATNLKNHQRIHTGEKPFKCEVCAKSFGCSQNMKRHRKIHTGEKPFKCKICDKSFSHDSALKWHQTIHAGEKPFKCEVCSKLFSRASYLRKHRKIHSGDKPFKFTESCDYILKDHQLKHSEEKPFKCEVCSKIFTSRRYMKIHQRTHTEEKPFECKVCSKSFSESSNFKKHQKLHTGVKAYKCETCPKSFDHRSNQQAHMKTHTEDKTNISKFSLKSRSKKSVLLRGEKKRATKSFQCKICSKYFAKSTHLELHEEMHHEEVDDGSPNQQKCMKREDANEVVVCNIPNMFLEDDGTEAYILKQDIDELKTEELMAE